MVDIIEKEDEDEVEDADEDEEVDDEGVFSEAVRLFGC